MFSPDWSQGYQNNFDQAEGSNHGRMDNLSRTLQFRCKVGRILLRHQRRTLWPWFCQFALQSIISHLGHEKASCFGWLFGEPLSFPQVVVEVGTKVANGTFRQLGVSSNVFLFWFCENDLWLTRVWRYVFEWKMCGKTMDGEHLIVL